MQNKKYIVILLFGLLLGSCKSSRTLNEGNSNYKLSANQLIKENAKKTPNFNTLQSKLKITYSQGNKTQSYTVSYRMKKDEVLWINAPLGILRAKITPEKVSFYNKLDKTFFSGDFNFFSNLLGTELNFQQIQNLLIGETLFNLKEQPYKLSIHEDNYALQPKKQPELFEIFFLLNPSHYKVISQQLSQTSEFRHLEINYLKYQEINAQILPEQVKIIAVEGNEEVIAELELKSVTLNGELRFPFKIPSGYKEVKL